MQTISGERKSGKTELLLKQYEPGDIVVTGYHNQRERYLNSGVLKEDLFSYTDIENGKHRGKRPGKILIDDIDTFLFHFLSGTGAIIASFTGQDITGKLKAQETELYKILEL